MLPMWHWMFDFGVTVDSVTTVQVIDDILMCALGRSTLQMSILAEQCHFDSNNLKKTIW